MLRVTEDQVRKAIRAALKPLWNALPPEQGLDSVELSVDGAQRLMDRVVRQLQAAGTGTTDPDRVSPERAALAGWDKVLRQKFLDLLGKVEELEERVASLASLWDSHHDRLEELESQQTDHDTSICVALDLLEDLRDRVEELEEHPRPDDSNEFLRLRSRIRRLEERMDRIDRPAEAQRRLRERYHPSGTSSTEGDP